MADNRPWLPHIITSHDLTLANRVVMAPMTRSSRRSSISSMGSPSSLLRSDHAIIQEA